MSQTSLSVWFVCRLCRGSFGQVDAFIEHKKQKHFNEFQNTTSIVFEERELGSLYPVFTIDGDHPLADEISEPSIKIEVNDEVPVIPFSSEINEELNLNLVEPKSEPITFECKINSDSKNSFFGLKRPEQNPYVLLKRLTSEEIQSACVPKHHSTLVKCEQTIFVNRLEHPNSPDTDSNTIDHNGVQKSAEIQPTANVRISTERDPLFECKLCLKQLESDAQLKIHVEICALYHKARNRFCVICNRKFSKTNYLKEHRLRFHGTEEDKLSLFKFKCHVCSKQYRRPSVLSYHVESHKEKKLKVTSKCLKCSHPNCGKEFRNKSGIQIHIATIHLGARPFSCHFPNCNKTFSQSGNFNVHLRSHTGERPFKCTVDNCNKPFITSYKRLMHHRNVHCNYSAKILN